MSAIRFTIVDDGRATEVDAERSGARVRLSRAGVHDALGWDVTEDGLCRDTMCLGAPRAWADGGGIDLDELASVLGRPLALDADEGTAWLGASADERARALRTLTAPDFALPDLDGRMHRLSEHRGTKVLLVVWASW
jgi:hypothetical protein